MSEFTVVNLLEVEDMAPRFGLSPEVVELGPLEAVRVAPTAARCLEGGPDGAEVLAFGAPSHDNRDAEMLPGWWGSDSDD